MKSNLRIRLAAATALVACATAFAAPAWADTAFDPGASSKTAGASASPADAAMPGLRRFPLEGRELSFDGENRRLDFPFFITAAESAVKSKLVLDFESAISVLPETSRMVVTVNDAVVADTVLGKSGSRKLVAELPGGLMQPGFNAVRIVVEQHHRVDCSLGGSYELWTKLVPARSGFVFDGGTADIASLADLPFLPPADDGRIHLRGLVGSGATGSVVDSTISAIQSAVLLGYFESPVVDFSDKPGNGPGLDVAVGTLGELSGLGADLRGNTSIPFVSLLPAKDGRRQTLAISGITTEEVRHNLDEIVAAAKAVRPVGPAAGQRSLAMFQGRQIGSGESVSFADLGVDTRQFLGRFYRDSYRFILPADFYAADYDYASIVLDASFAGGLSSDAQLVMRANDKVVATLSLGSSKPGLIEKQRMRVPLQTLKPGVNVISMEAMLPKAADATCDASEQLDPSIRFNIADTSSFTMPHFARVGHAPDISAMTAGIAEANRAVEKNLTVLVPNYDRPTLGAAATFVARIASATRKLQPVHTVSTMPLALDDDLLAFGSLSTLPSQLFTTLRVTPTGGGGTTSRIGIGSRLLASPASAATQEPPGGNGIVDETAAPAEAEETLVDGLKRKMAELADSAEQIVQQARDFASAQTTTPVFEPDFTSALVIAQTPSPNAPSSTWTVVTATGTDRIVNGVGMVTERNRWAQLGGAVTEIASADGNVTVHPASSERIYETQPRSLGNARLILAGWFSRHIEQYLVALIGTLLLLGFATALFLRGIGEKNS